MLIIIYKMVAYHGLIKAVFNISITILGTLIWACPNLILKVMEMTHFPIKCHSSFLILTTQYKHSNDKIKDKCNV